MVTVGVSGGCFQTSTYKLVCILFLTDENVSSQKNHNIFCVSVPKHFWTQCYAHFEISSIQLLNQYKSFKDAFKNFDERLFDQIIVNTPRVSVERQRDSDLSFPCSNFLRVCNSLSSALGFFSTHNLFKRIGNPPRIMFYLSE